MKNTDPHTGKVNNNTGDTILAVSSGQNINTFDDYSIPWDRFGGKIYIWLVDNTTNKIVSAAKLYDKDDSFHFVNDQDLNPTIQVQTVTRTKKDCNEIWETGHMGIRLYTRWGGDIGDEGSSTKHQQMHNTLFSVRADPTGNLIPLFSCSQ
jgi:hypothetical protein